MNSTVLDSARIVNLRTDLDLFKLLRVRQHGQHSRFWHVLFEHLIEYLGKNNQRLNWLPLRSSTSKSN